MNLRFDKYADGLVPAIVQDALTGAVLMLGFMNEESLQATIGSGRVTFYSRSKKGLWQKGESSGNYLAFRFLVPDCDNDTILINALPNGPICHKGSDTCFGDGSAVNRIPGLIGELEATISDRCERRPEDSYVARLFSEGIPKIAQKVGEEAVEVAIASLADDQAELKAEAADLLFHLLVLLHARGLSFEDVLQELDRRRG